MDHCINNGILDCDNGEAVEDRPIDTFGNKVGGIVGCLYSSKIGGNEYSNKDISVSNCENNGDIFSGMMAAGIVASASNSGSDYFVRINNCINNAKIVSGSSQAGIVTDASCSGAELTISGCRNTAAISDGLSAGIVCKLTPTSGNVSITECVNSGDIQSSELYAGGIIRSVYVFGDISAKLLVNGCSNTGKITTPESGGGIIGFINSTGTLSVSDEASLKINSCINQGEIFTYSSNSFIGGIIGGFGLKGVPSEITDCINTGTLSVDDKAPSKETINSEKTMNLSRMCGGIVGRIGETLYLSTSADQGDSANVNAEDALIKISGCYSNGMFNVPAEDKYKNHRGEVIWDNQLGGIVGNCSAEEGYAFIVDNCGFANTERGLGIKGYEDLGKLISASEIDAKVK